MIIRPLLFRECCSRCRFQPYDRAFLARANVRYINVLNNNNNNNCPLRGVDPVRLQILLTGTRRQCGRPTSETCIVFYSPLFHHV